MEYVVYDKDLAKDIQKKCGQFMSQYGLKLSGSIDYQVCVILEKVGKPKAIQNDMLLKKIVRDKTNPIYDRLLNTVAMIIFKAQKISPVPTKKILDDSWDEIQAEMKDAGTEIQKEAIKVLKDYLEKRGEGKAAIKAANYRYYKCGLALVGAVASVALTGASVVATSGASIAALGLAIAGTVKASHALGREVARQNKSIEEVYDSLAKTATALEKALNNAKGHERGVTNAREATEKVVRALIDVNIPSIKKLKQDADLLAEKGKKQVLMASKIAALAKPYHDYKKELTAGRKEAQAALDALKAKFGTSPMYRSQIVLAEKAIRLMDKSIAGVQAVRDAKIADAEARRTSAIQAIADAKKYQTLAERYEFYRSDWVKFVGWSAEVLPTVVQVSTQDWTKINATATKAMTLWTDTDMDTIAGTAQAAGEALTSLGMFIKEKLAS
jgi:hypothetical protein